MLGRSIFASDDLEVFADEELRDAPDEIVCDWQLAEKRANQIRSEDGFPDGPIDPEAIMALHESELFYRDLGLPTQQ